jgi:hypothetical protein
MLCADGHASLAKQKVVGRKEPQPIIRTSQLPAHSRTLHTHRSATRDGHFSLDTGKDIRTCYRPFSWLDETTMIYAPILEQGFISIQVTMCSFDWHNPRDPSRSRCSHKWCRRHGLARRIGGAGVSERQLVRSTGRSTSCRCSAV